MGIFGDIVDAVTGGGGGGQTDGEAAAPSVSDPSSGGGNDFSGGSSDGGSSGGTDGSSSSGGSSGGSTGGGSSGGGAGAVAGGSAGSGGGGGGGGDDSGGSTPATEPNFGGDRGFGGTETPDFDSGGGSSSGGSSGGGTETGGGNNDAPVPPGTVTEPQVSDGSGDGGGIVVEDDDMSTGGGSFGGDSSSDSIDASSGALAGDISGESTLEDAASRPVGSGDQDPNQSNSDEIDVELSEPNTPGENEFNSSQAPDRLEEDLIEQAANQSDSLNEGDIRFLAAEVGETPADDPDALARLNETETQEIREEAAANNALVEADDVAITDIQNGTVDVEGPGIETEFGPSEERVDEQIQATIDRLDRETPVRDIDRDDANVTVSDDGSVSVSVSAEPIDLSRDESAPEVNSNSAQFGEVTATQRIDDPLAPEPPGPVVATQRNLAEIGRDIQPGLTDSGRAAGDALATASVVPTIEEAATGTDNFERFVESAAAGGAQILNAPAFASNAIGSADVLVRGPDRELGLEDLPGGADAAALRAGAEADDINNVQTDELPQTSQQFVNERAGEKAGQLEESVREKPVTTTGRLTGQAAVSTVVGTGLVRAGPRVATADVGDIDATAGVQRLQTAGDSIRPDFGGRVTGGNTRSPFGRTDGINVVEADFEDISSTRPNPVSGGSGPFSRLPRNRPDPSTTPTTGSPTESSIDGIQVDGLGGFDDELDLDSVTSTRPDPTASERSPFDDPLRDTDVGSAASGGSAGSDVDGINVDDLGDINDDLGLNDIRSTRPDPTASTRSPFDDPLRQIDDTTASVESGTSPLSGLGRFADTREGSFLGDSRGQVSIGRVLDAAREPELRDRGAGPRSDILDTRRRDAGVGFVPSGDTAVFERDAVGAGARAEPATFSGLNAGFDTGFNFRTETRLDADQRLDIESEVGLTNETTTRVASGTDFGVDTTLDFDVGTRTRTPRDEPPEQDRTRRDEPRSEFGSGSSSREADLGVGFLNETVTALATGPGPREAPSEDTLGEFEAPSEQRPTLAQLTASGQKADAIEAAEGLLFVGGGGESESNNGGLGLL